MPTRMRDVSGVAALYHDKDWLGGYNSLPVSRASTSGLFGDAEQHVISATLTGAKPETYS